MPVCSAVPVELTASERHRLKKMAHGHKTPHQARQRATIVLLAARGHGNAQIAAETHLHVDTVRSWRGRFAAGRMPALADRKRSGRPSTFTPLQVAEVKALACQLPTESGAPLSRWSCPELAREAVTRAITETVSASTVRRWLKDDALKPWQHRSWIFVRDPNFRAAAQRVLDLYAGVFDGAPLGEDEYVLSADEKTSIQARCRCHPTLAPGQARAMRVNHTYGPGGALAYLAAYDIHRAEVLGRCEQTTGIVPFMKLVEQVMTSEPYASAKRVFFIVDNGSRQVGHRPPGLQVPERRHGPHSRPRLLAEPNRDLLLHRAAQGRLTQRLHRSRRGPGPAPSIRRPLQRHGTAVPVEIHHLRPGRSTGPTRPASTRPTRRILHRTRSMINPR
jgi:transposase